MKNNRWILVLGGLALGIMLTLFAGAIVVNDLRPTERVLWQSCQPDDLIYDDFGPYCLSVVEGALNWEFLPLARVRHHFVFVGRGTEVSYGHYTDYSPHKGVELMADYVRGLAVEWTAEGVTLSEPSGHRLFIPAEGFTGGR